MKISLNWLKDYVALDASIDEITRAITFLGFEVEGVQTTGAGDMFTSCYVANRAAGADPRRAVELASELVARELEKRLQVGSSDLV